MNSFCHSVAKCTFDREHDLSTSTPARLQMLRDFSVNIGPGAGRGKRQRVNNEERIRKSTSNNKRQLQAEVHMQVEKGVSEDTAAESSEFSQVESGKTLNSKSPHLKRKAANRKSKKKVVGDFQMSVTHEFCPFADWKALVNDLGCAFRTQQEIKQLLVLR